MGLPKYLLWLDFETTSLDPVTTTVLEVFWELTDWSLEPVASGYGIASAQLIIADQAVLDMHERSGLAAACFDEPRTGRVAHAMHEMLPAALDGIGEKVALAGSGVASFDRLIINAKYHGVAEHLTYWSLDMGPIRRLAEGTGYGYLALPESDIAHRAEADVRRAQDEFRQWVRVFGQATVGQF